MADRCTPGCSRESPICDQRDASIDTVIAADGLGRCHHLRHSAASRALVADNDDFAGLNQALSHCVVGLLLTVEDPRLRVDNLTLIIGAGRVFDDRAVRRKVALQDRNGALLLHLLHRENNLLPLQSVVMQISQIPIEPVILLQILQVFSQGLARHGHDIQIQIIPQHPLHHRNAAGEPECLCDLCSGRIDIADMRNLMVDLIEELDRQLHTGLSCNRGQMQRCVRGSADG